MSEEVGLRENLRLDTLKMLLALLLAGCHPLELVSVFPLHVLQNFLETEYLFHEFICRHLELLLCDPLGVQPGKTPTCHLIDRG